MWNIIQDPDFDYFVLPKEIPINYIEFKKLILYNFFSCSFSFTWILFTVIVVFILTLILTKKPLNTTDINTDININNNTDLNTIENFKKINNLLKINSYMFPSLRE